MMNYPWPGNVRELKSVFEYAFVTCQEDLIQPHHLPPAIFQEKKPLPTVHKTPFNRDEIKKKHLIEALDRTGGNQSEAARLLDVSRVTVWNRMKRYNVNLKKEYKI